MKDHAHTLSDLPRPYCRSSASPAAGAAATTSPGSWKSTAMPKLPELRHVLANCPKVRSLSIHDRCEYARHLERMIASIWAEPRAVSLGDLDFSTCPRPGFRTEGAGEAREPGPIRQSPRVAPNSQGRNNSLTISAC